MFYERINAKVFRRSIAFVIAIVVPTFVWLFRDDAATAKGPVCNEGTSLRDFAVVLLMPTRALKRYAPKRKSFDNQ